MRTASPAGAPRGAAGDIDAALRTEIEAALDAGEAASAIAKRLSQRFSRKRRDVYALVLDMQDARLR